MCDRRKRLRKCCCGGRLPAIKGRPKRVDDTSKKGVADRCARHLARAANNAARRELADFAEQHAADCLLAKIDRQAVYAAFEHQ